MAFLSSIFGKKGKLKEVPQYGQSQMGAQEQLLQQSLPMILQLLQQQSSQNKFDFGPIAEQAKTQFQQETVPTIAERFTSMGGGRLSSPSFAQQLGSAGAGLNQNLAAMEQQFGLQNRSLDQQDKGMQLQTLLSLLGIGLQPRTQQYYRPGQPGLFGNFLGGVGQGLQQAGQQTPNNLMQLLMRLGGGL